jgi:hypothetical protein
MENVKQIYCVKCKKKTKTKNCVKKKSKNNRNMLSGKCFICDTKKNVFTRAF